MELSSQDLLAIPLRPLHHHLADALVASGCQPNVVEAMVRLLYAAELCAIVCVLAGGLAALRQLRQWADRAGVMPRSAVHVLSAVIAVVAFGLFLWIVRRPSADVASLIGRFDHLALCALGGYSLSHLSLVWRKWSLSLGSLCILGQHAGWTPVEVVMGAGALGFAALKLRPHDGVWATATVQGIILAATLCAAWRMRSSNPLQALIIEGLFAFVVLRHISFVVEARRGYSMSLGDYLCYMLFYPSCVGASEVYNEFYERNLCGAARFDYGTVVRHVIRGSVEMWVALLLPVSLEATVQIQHTATLWLNVLAVFLRSSLFVMGFWAVITACACFYGVELRPNFAGILRCENPSQFWRAWRGTMTRWLIQYVYIPLGGNRRHQTRNVAAAFAASTLWHCMGVPFLGPRVLGWNFAPMILWGAFNAAGVIVYTAARKRDWSVVSQPVPPALQRGTKILLTACFGTFTVTLLGFSPTTIDYFGSFLRTLAGLQAW